MKALTPLSRTACAAALALLGLPALAAMDAMDSPRCKAALAQLDAASSAVAKDKTGGTPQVLKHARERVANACFGQQADAPTGQRAPTPPIAVPRAAQPSSLTPAPANPFEPARNNPSPLSYQPAPAPVEIPRQATISSCDPSGCWDSNGGRLNRFGPDLVGPRGPCTTQGSFVSCP